MWKTHSFLNNFALVQLDDLNIGKIKSTQLLISGKNDPMPSLKGYCGLFEKPKLKMFQGAP